MRVTRRLTISQMTTRPWESKVMPLDSPLFCRMSSGSLPSTSLKIWLRRMSTNSS